MEDDYSDILGSGVLNVKPQSSLPFGVKASLWICTLVLLYIIGATAWKNFLRWRELSYRLAMRRRHGIPDDDHRPFNVAYASVQHAREKREALRRSKSRPMSNTAREQPPSSAQDLRQRTGPTRNVEATWMKDRAESLPKGYRHSTTAGPSRYNPVNNGQQPVLQNEEKVLYPRSTELVTSANHPTAAPVRISKIQSGSRRRNYAYMDIDQGSLRSSDAEPLERATFKRGSKREYGDAEETEDVLESKRAREKRARKISLDKANLVEDMEVEEHEFEDENADYGQVSRGKKRDREEAGSTFGGDDEDHSEPEEAEDDTTTRRRSRKRRSVAKRKSDLATITRGKKRDRDIDEETSDEGSDRGYTQTSARKRRNKKEGISDEEDVSMEESPAKGKGRKIGEEWTSNGAHYKIGPNGQRLRQALVKKARQKYHMPEDSQHPDRDANLEVYVETWLAEEEYQDAKTRHLLAWQDTPKASVERDTHEVAQPPPSPVGKSLLWKSTATPPATTPDGGSPTSEFSGSAYPTTKGRISYDPRRQSITADVATRVNPFHQYPAQASKRIASGSARVSSAGLVDSTNSSPRTGHRMYSKWEKQDLEANAMMKMREVARKKENEEKERQEKERQEKERAEREKAEKVKVAIPSVPIITVTEPAEDKPAVIPSFFAKPAVPPKDAASSPVAILSPVSLPGSGKSGEKATTLTESKASSFPSATPAATPFTFAVPGSSPFAPVAKSTVDSTKPGEQPKPPPFAPPQPSSVTSTSNPAPATSTPSFFSFPKLSAVPEPKKPEQNGQTSGASLLSRLKPDAAPTAPLQPSTFSFTKPTEAPKSFFSTPTTTASGLAAQPSASTSTTSTMSNATGGSSALKFDFKAPKTATAATPAGTAPNASKPGSDAGIFSFKPTIAPSAESNAAAGGATPFKFVFNPQTAKDAGGTMEDNGGQGNKQTLTFSGFGAPASKPAPSVFFSAGAAGDKTSQPGFGAIGTSSDKSGPSFTPKFDTTAPNGGANKPTGFSAFSNVQNSSSTPDSSSKPPVFGSSGTAAFGMSGALGGTPSFNASKPSDGTMFSFGKTSTAPASTPATSTVPNYHSSFALNDTSKAQNLSNAPSTVSFPVNRTPLNKAGASETAATAFSAPPNLFQTASSSGGSTTNPTTTVFGAGGSGQPAPNSTSSSLFGALGSGNGQSVSNTTASSGPFGANPASTFGASRSQSIFGATSNSTSTPTPFGGAQSAFPTTNTSQSPFGAPSGHPVPSSAPTTTSSVFGGPSVFGNAATTKPGNSGTTLPFGAFGNTSQSTNNPIPQNSASVIQFGQTSMGTPNNTGGQS